MSEATSINQLVCFYSVHDEKFDFSSSPKRKNSKDVYKKDIRKGVWEKVFLKQDVKNAR